MTHEEKCTWLIRQLLSEDKAYKRYEIPADYEQQKIMLRSLMNIRMPGPASDEFYKIQDEFLQEEKVLNGITDVRILKPVKKNAQICLWQGDITTLNADAIVNAANSQMCGCFRPMHNCIDNIIHTKAGMQLRWKCAQIMRMQGHEEPTGQAKITPAYNLPCKFVLHTVGPIVDGRLTRRHEDLLASCYRSCLELAEVNGVKSIAFCCISTGVFMFPAKRAAEIAVATVEEYLNREQSDMKVIFNVFKDTDLEIYDRILN